MNVPTASVSAIADVLSLRKQDGWLTPPLSAIVPANCRASAEVVTVQMESRESGADFKSMYELLSGDHKGKVLVIAGAIDIRGAIWGEILTSAAMQAGFAGVAVDGFVRDLPAVAALGFPMYASGTAVVGPLGHAHVVSVGTVVNIGGCEIAPGDHVVLDDSGCVRIKANELQEVLLAATEYEEAEEKVLSAITSGERLNSAYRHKADVVARLRR